MTPLIFVRFLTLFVFANCIGWCIAWIVNNRKDWLYASPPLGIFLHATVYYTFYLIDYMGLRGVPFKLQWYADWGSTLMLHISFTSLFILIDLVTNFFTKQLVRIRERYFSNYG